MARLPLLLLLLLLLSCDPAAGKKRSKKAKPTAGAGFSGGGAHPQQPKWKEVKEEDIPAGTPVKKIKQGEVLNLAENAEREANREQPEEVVKMFDAVMTDDFGSLNKVLMEDKIPVDIRGPNGYTPLFQAVFSHKINSAHMLIEAGANPKLRNNQGFNALDAAAYGGCVQCVHMLLKHGMNPHAIGRDGYAPLHRAIWGDDPEHTEIVELLLDAGASPSKLAHVPQQGTLAPIDMVNDNSATRRVLKRALEKEAARKANAEKAQQARTAEAAKADSLFGKTPKEEL